MVDTNLSKLMRDAADGDFEMHRLADEFDRAVKSGTPPQIVGAWARARRYYCEKTGEDLL